MDPLVSSTASTFCREVQVKMDVTNFRKNFVTTAGLVALILMALSPPAAAQGGCLKGNVSFTMSVNGKIELCSQYLEKIPELQKQLDQLQKTASGNQEMMRELTRSARSVNALGRNVDANRQVELLQSFSRELQGLIGADQKKTQQQIAQLSDKLDSLQDKVTQSKEDQQTAVQTMTALNGKLGDAIAALDLTKAEQQLDAIQANLKSIEANTARTNQILEEQNAREKEAAERQKKEAEEQNNDPNLYTRAQIMSLGHPFQSPIMRYMIFMYSRPPLYPPFVDSELSIAFRKGTESWRLDLTDKAPGPGGELWKVNFGEVGDRAALCFVAHDKASGRLREWTQHYKITPSSAAGGSVNFVPEGDAAMRLTDGGPCDGVTTVRPQPSTQAEAAPPAPSAADSAAAAQEQTNKLLAQQQAMIASMRERGKTSASAAAFTRITAEGSRRDHMNGDKWLIKVNVQPFRPGTTLYDVHIEASLMDPAGHATPLQFSNRQLFVNIESRSAFVDHMGTQAVVCLTAKGPDSDKPQRLTQHFTIETGRVYWNDGGVQHPGDQATFVPSAPATLADASAAPCQ